MSNPPAIDAKSKFDRTFTSCKYNLFNFRIINEDLLYNNTVSSAVSCSAPNGVVLRPLISCKIFFLSSNPITLYDIIYDTPHYSLIFTSSSHFVGLQVVDAILDYVYFFIGRFLSSMNKPLTRM